MNRFLGMVASLPTLAMTLFLIAGSSNALAAGESTALGEPLTISGEGTMTVYQSPKGSAEPLNLWIHFHGSPAVAAKNFTKAKIRGVLVVINFKGLSAAYSKPFRESPELFSDILEKTSKQLAPKEAPHWKRLTVSSFSAGYGAVRELLKTPKHFERIDALVAADSLYASLEEGAVRQPLHAHMRDYRRFAKLAAEGKKAFTLTHSNQETTYASTTETANDLIKSLGIERQWLSRQDGNMRLRSQATKGQFSVLGYDGTEGEDHLQHLRQIHLWWGQL